jgi:hypothetical protein
MGWLACKVLSGSLVFSEASGATIKSSLCSDSAWPVHFARGKDDV